MDQEKQKKKKRPKSQTPRTNYVTGHAINTSFVENIPFSPAQGPMVRGSRVIMASDRILRRYFMLISHYWELREVRLCVGVCLHVEIGVDIGIPESLSHLRQKDNNFLILPLVGYQYILSPEASNWEQLLTPIIRVNSAMAHPSIPSSQCARFHIPSFFSRLSLLQGPTGSLNRSSVTF